MKYLKKIATYVFMMMIRKATRRFKFIKSLQYFKKGENYGNNKSFSNMTPNNKKRCETDNPFLSYFNKHTEGAGIWKWEHYFDIYQKHFSKFIGQEVHIMEVGVYSGGSLGMWREVFGAKGHVYGVDIEEACKEYTDDNIEIFIGNQADRSFWKDIKLKVPILDILVDDGGHHPEQQRITMEEMLPYLKPGGIYLCEDIHGTENQFAAYVQGFSKRINEMECKEMPNGVSGLASDLSNFQKAIYAIHLYPFCLVIEKRDEALSQFKAPKHGNKWQPFI